MSQQDLRQADLSGLTLKQMNSAQRAEMRRRLKSFIEAYVGKQPDPMSAPQKKVRKWVPGMKA